MEPGTLFQRKQRGKKYQFVIGGPTKDEILGFIREDIDYKRWVFVHSSDNAEFCFVPKSHFISN